VKQKYIKFLKLIHQNQNRHRNRLARAMSIVSRPSTTQKAFDALVYPKVSPVADASAKALKMRQMLSAMKGNRFAKPNKGMCKAGGNTRDLDSKKTWLYKEMISAASIGITKDEFFGLMKSTRILVTRTKLDKAYSVDSQPTTKTISIQTAKIVIEDIDDEATEFDPNA